MGRGRAGADAGTDKAGRRGGTRVTTPDQGGPTPRGAGDEARVASRPPPAPPRGPGGCGGGVRNKHAGRAAATINLLAAADPPPTDSWGVRRPREGRMPDPSGHDGPGRRQAPRRPHDTGRPTRDVDGTWNLRRPDRGGRPWLGDGGPSPDGLRRPGRGVASDTSGVCPRQRPLGIPPGTFAASGGTSPIGASGAFGGSGVEVSRRRRRVPRGECRSRSRPPCTTAAPPGARAVRAARPRTGRSVPPGCRVDPDSK